MNTVGLDIGTSGCKAVAYNENGRPLASAYREYDVQFADGGRAELDPDRVIDQCFAVIRACTAAIAPGSVQGLGVSSQGEAFTAVDGEGRALCRAMVSSDSRAADQALRWPATFGEDRLYRITGHTAHPMFTLFKLLWLRDREPDVWRRAWKFLCFEDLLACRLGVDPAMGWPLAGRTMLFDVTRHAWSGEILSAIGLAAGKLAHPLPSGTVSGTVAPDIAAQLGFGRKTAVVTGGHDQTCVALGAGVVEAGLAMYATGTVECITPAFSEAMFTDALRRANLCTYDHTVTGMYATVAFSLTGGNLLKWYRDEFGATEKREAEAAGRNVYAVLLEGLSPEPAQPMVLPHFTPTGTPHFDASPTGAIVGLKLSTTRAEFLRALLEGVAFEMRLNMDILEQSGGAIRELRAVGGGSRSARWNQLKADVTGKPLTTLDVDEAGCLGGALLACAACTGEAIPRLAARWVHPVDVVRPREDLRDWYSRRFEQYRELYPALKQFRDKTGPVTRPPA